MVLLRSVPRSSTSWLPLAPACRFPDRCRTPPCTRRSRTHILFRHTCWWELCSGQLPCRILDRSCSSPLPWGQPTRKSEHFEFHQDWQTFLQTGRAPRTLGDATIFPRGPSRALCLASSFGQPTDRRCSLEGRVLNARINYRGACGSMAFRACIVVHNGWVHSRSVGTGRDRADFSHLARPSADISNGAP